MDLTEYRDILVEFLKDVDFKFSPLRVNKSLYSETLRRCNEIDGWDKDWASYAFIGADIAQWFYPHINLNAQIDIAVASGTAAKIEDDIPYFRDVLNSYAREVRENKEISSPIMRAATYQGEGLRSTYPEHALNITWKSMYAFFYFLPLEAGINDFDMHRGGDTTISEIRRITSTSDIYSMWLFDKSIPMNEYMFLVPHLMRFMEVNDFLAFYKEEMVGAENNTVLFLRRKANSWCGKQTVLDSLQRSTKMINFLRGVQVREDVRNILDAFINNYITLHIICSRRYQLNELGLDAAFFGFEEFNAGPHIAATGATGKTAKSAMKPCTYNRFSVQPPSSVAA